MNSRIFCQQLLAAIMAPRFMCLCATTRASPRGSNPPSPSSHLLNHQGMHDRQLLHLIRVLERKRIWALNVGENFEISLDAWAEFTKLLPGTAVAYLYVSTPPFPSPSLPSPPQLSLALPLSAPLLSYSSASRPHPHDSSSPPLLPSCHSLPLPSPPPHAPVSSPHPLLSVPCPLIHSPPLIPLLSSPPLIDSPPPHPLVPSPHPPPILPSPPAPLIHSLPSPPHFAS